MKNRRLSHAAPNNGMHPTPHQDVSHVRCAGGAGDARHWIAFLILSGLFGTMAIYDDKWFEVWYSDGVDVTPTYLLIVTSNPNKPSHIVIVDPFEKNKTVFEATDYEAATDWLLEDEYHLAAGRQFPDDGWPLQTGATRS